MIKNNKILAFLVFLVLINIINAQVEEDKYTTPDFYLNSNPASWDYSKVQWQFVPTSVINSIPAENLPYFQLSSAQRLSMNVEQIAYNFDNINDLTKDVDKEKAEDAIQQKYDVTVDLGEGAGLKNGVLQANFGEREHVSLTSEVYKNGFLTITNDGEIVFIPDEKIIILDIPEADILTVKNLKNPTAFQDYEVEGTFKVDEGRIVFLKDEKAIIDNIEIDAILNDVDLCKTKSECSGNYIFLGENELVAEGDLFSLNFLPGNKYFNVEKDSIPLPNNLFLSRSDSLLNIFDEPNDLLKIYIGNDEKSGRITVIKEKSMLPEIKTDNWVRIENDANIVTIDVEKVKKDLIFDISKEKIPYSQLRTYSPSHTTSVSLAVVANGDVDSVIIFDESSSVLTLDRITYDATIVNRRALSESYGISLTGYFSPLELSEFNLRLGNIENELGIDLENIYMNVGNEKLSLSLYEMDRIAFGDLEARAGVSSKSAVIIFWGPPLSDNLKSGRKIGYKIWRIPSYIKARKIIEEDIVHEFGHVIGFMSDPTTINTRLNDPSFKVGGPFSEAYKKTAKESGFANLEPTLSENMIAPDSLLPTSYSENNIGEHMAEIFRTMVDDPEWFTDRNVPEEIRKQRQAFRDLFLEELEKYR